MRRVPAGQLLLAGAPEGGLEGGSQVRVPGRRQVRHKHADLNGKNARGPVGLGHTFSAKALRSPLPRSMACCS